MIEAKTHANGKKFTLEANDVNGDGVINIDDLQWETSGLTEGLRTTGPRRVREGHQGQRRRTGRREYHAPRLPPRLELHHPPHRYRSK
jgi:hypothetical protein